jgi:biopolymer transport protein ExbD/biopolymer transport protein TolR
MAGAPRPLGGSGLHRPLAEINVTPLVDVMLVLLIVFMVTAPIMATGLKVDLPQAKSAQVVNPKEPIVVSITADGNVAIGTQTMAMADLIPALQKMTNGDTSRIIQIRADKAAAYGTIVTAIDALASNGMIHIALISDPKSRGAAPPAAAPQPAPKPTP